MCRVFSNQASSSTIAESRNNEELNRFQAIVYDAVGLNFGIRYNQEVEEPPNPYVKNFYELLDAAQKPLWSGCVDHIELFFALR